MASIDDHQAYFIFRVPPRREAVAELILRKRGYDPLIPKKYIKRRSKNGRHRNGPRELVEMTAIPGYIFVPLHSEFPPLFDLMRLQIIRAVVGFNGIPGRIGTEYMGEFCRKIGAKPRIGEEHGLKKGSTVRIQEGPFFGYTGVVEGVKGAHADILVQFFGRPTPLNLSVDDLAEEESSPKILTKRKKRLQSRPNQSINHDQCLA